VTLKRAAALAAAAGGLVLAQVAGMAVVAATGLPIPGAVAGLLLMLAALAAWGRIPLALSDLAALLLRHLNLFFVPAGVGLMAHLDLLARDGAALIIAIGVSTLVGMAVAAAVFVWASNPVSGGGR